MGRLGRLRSWLHRGTYAGSVEAKEVKEKDEKKIEQKAIESASFSHPDFVNQYGRPETSRRGLALLGILIITVVGLYIGNQLQILTLEYEVGFIGAAALVMIWLRSVFHNKAHEKAKLITLKSDIDELGRKPYDDVVFSGLLEPVVSSSPRETIGDIITIAKQGKGAAERATLTKLLTEYVGSENTEVIEAKPSKGKKGKEEDAKVDEPKTRTTKQGPALKNQITHLRFDRKDEKYSILLITKGEPSQYLPRNNDAEIETEYGTEKGTRIKPKGGLLWLGAYDMKRTVLGTIEKTWCSIYLVEGPSYTAAEIRSFGIYRSIARACLGIDNSEQLARDVEEYAGRYAKAIFAGAKKDQLDKGDSLDKLNTSLVNTGQPPKQVEKGKPWYTKPTYVVGLAVAIAVVSVVAGWGIWSILAAR